MTVICKASCDICEYLHTQIGRDEFINICDVYILHYSNKIRITNKCVEIRQCRWYKDTRIKNRKCKKTLKMVKSLKMLSFEEIADLLAHLYASEFNGKNNGRFRIARPELARLSGREYIERSSVKQIISWLAEKHGLLMIDMNDEFPIIKFSILRRYRKATSRVLEEVLGVSSEIESSHEDE